MTRKQKTGLFLGIFIPLGFIANIGLFYVFLLIVFNWPYHIHRPAVLNRTGDVFSDADGNVYCYQSRGIYRYDSLDVTKQPQRMSFVDENGESLGLQCMSRDDSYFYVGLHDGNRGGHTNYTIQVFDQHFDMVDSMTFQDEMAIDGMCAVDGNVYYVLRDIKNDNYRTLYCYNVNSKERVTVKDNIEKDTRVINGEHEIYYDQIYYLQITTSKTKLNYWWDDKLDNSHLFFEDVFDLCFDTKSIYLTFNGEKCTFEKDRNFNTFCSKATLVDNKIIFATYEYIKNKECGNYRDYYCICNQGKSFLYVLDLDTKELNLIDEYEVGAFLIDYDLEGAKYYYDGGLYINNVFYRECEKIEPGPIETKRGENYFRFEERKLDYDVSYYKGEFYGI